MDGDKIKENIIDLKQTKITDWYDKLLDDLWSLAQTKMIEFKHQIGKRIIQDWDKFGKPEYGNKFVENLAKDLQVGSREVYRCIQFARSFPQLEDMYTKVSQRDKISWRWITTKLLPDHKEEKNEVLPLPEGKYNIIYADPPWSYGGNLPQRNPVKHYDTLETPEIAQMPVNTIAGDNSCLFLWATFPKLPDALEVIKAWGFEYKTLAFVWIKQNKNKKGLFWGLGGWTRSNSEICLLGVKGNPERKNADVHSVIMSPIEEHSKKPDETRERILNLCGDLPRIELFCRNPITGWDAWGDEIEK